MQKSFSNSTPIKQTRMQKPKTESIISEDFDTSMSWDSAGSGYASVDFTELPFELDSTCSSLESSSIEIIESEIISSSSSDDEIMEESFADLMEELLELCVDDTPWNHFSKLHHIGQGSSGTVFLSESPSGEKVAIKEIILKKLKNKQLLLNEICAMQNIVHPNLLPLNEAFIYEDAVDSQLKVAIVTPFAELGNLIRFCKKTRHSEKLTALILRQVLQGLSELHRNSIAHRDIKSDNVFLKKDGTVFLSDFGFCDVADEEGKCAGNSVIGTPYWMAPEVIKFGASSINSDIWSVGILALELFDGEPPLMSKFGSIEALKLIAGYSGTVAPAGPMELPERFSPLFRHFLNNCFALNPMCRASCQQLLNHPFLTPCEGVSFADILS